MDISIIAGQKIPDWTSMKKDITDIKTEAQKIIKHINNQRDALKAGTADIQNKIQKTQEMFDNWKKTADAEIKSYKDKTFVDFDEKDNRCRKMIADTDQILSEINDISQKGTAVQQLIVGCQVTDMLSELEKFLEERKEVRMSSELKLSPILDLNYRSCK